MTALDELLQLGKPIYVNEQPSRRGSTPTQRAKVTLENNIAYLNDKTFTVNGPRGPKPPVRCFEAAGSKSKVWLTYLNKKVDLGDGIISIELPEDKIEDGLNAMIKLVESGHLNETLAKLSSDKKDKSASRKNIDHKS